MTSVCVFCASSSRIDGRYVDLASEVGGEIARRGWTLVSGGGSVSCMGAVATAARSGGARTVGIIPEALTGLEVTDEDSDELVVTADMRSRKGEMDARSDAFLVLPGGLGTLEELFEIWSARALGLHVKPVVLLDPAGLYEPLRQLVDSLVAAGFVPIAARDALTVAGSVAEAFDALEGQLAEPARRLHPTNEEFLEAEP